MEVINLKGYFFSSFFTSYVAAAAALCGLVCTDGWK